MSVSIASSTLKLIQVKKLNFPGMEKTFHRDRKLLTDQICRQKKNININNCFRFTILKNHSF